MQRDEEAVGSVAELGKAIYKVLECAWVLSVRQLRNLHCDSQWLAAVLEAIAASAGDILG